MEKFLIIANADKPCNDHARKMYDFVDEFRYLIMQSKELDPKVKNFIKIKAGICTGKLTLFSNA
jgi:hypothetical protein